MKRAALFFVCLTIAFSSCKSGSDQSVSEDKSSITGEWQVVLWLSKGVSIPLDSDHWISMTFKKNGDYITTGHVSGEENVEIAKEIWRVKEKGKIHFYTDPEDADKMKDQSKSIFYYKFSGDTLILEGVGGPKNDLLKLIRREK